MTTRTRAAAAAFLLTILNLIVAAPIATAADPVTQSFAYTGSEQQFVVPEGVTSIHVVLVGGAGGNGYPFAQGGQGAMVEGDLSVTPGMTVYVEVGANGADGTDPNGAPASFNGGGAGGDAVSGGAGAGGGASDIRTIPRALAGSPGSRLMVA